MLIKSAAELKGQLEESVRFIRKFTDSVPQIGIILGSGLGELANRIDVEVSINYRDIPNFPLSTVEFHEGKLIFGKISGKEVVVMQGRFHFYEGYSPQQITFPVRTMRFLGAKILIISNACGSMNPDIPKGEIMAIEDHIFLPGLAGHNPLVGINDDSFGPRFPDMSQPWSARLIELAEKEAEKIGIKLYKGVYVAVSGPNLETRAEYRFLRAIGADVVGMSTAPENIAARQMGMEVLGFSVVTDECYPETLKPLKIEDVLATAAKAEPKLTLLTEKVIEKI